MIFQTRTVFAFAASIALSTFARGETVVLNPVADAFVAAAHPSNNYGGGGALSVAAAGLSQGEFQSLLRFNLAMAQATFDATYGAGQWTINTIALGLTAASPNNAIFNPSAAGQFSIDWLANDSWVEGNGTPGAPSATGVTFAALTGLLSPADAMVGSFPFNGATSGANTYGLTADASLFADAAGGNPLSLRLYAADGAVSYLFNSRTFSAPAARPQLIVTATPEPTTLLSMLMVSMCAIRRRS